MLDRAAAEPGGPATIVFNGGALPRYLTAEVAGERVGIIHGDPESLAGWRLALEAMEPATRGCAARWAGAAGLPAFAGTTYGVMTRLLSDPRPPPDSLYGTAVGTLRCDALPVRFDQQRWR